MSQSPLARSTRRSLASFAQQPSKLSKSTSLRDLHEPPSTPTYTPSSPSTPDEPESSSSPSVSSRRFTTPDSKPKLLTPSRYRNVGSGAASSTPATSTPTTHLTPKIVYSPYATSTPPAQLSRSSSVPFDIAGSAKAGRKAEMESARKYSGGDGSSNGKKKRFVRKKSVLQRLIDLPSNLIDQTLLSMPSTLQDLLPPPNYAIPISLIVHAIHFLLLAPLFGYGKQGRPDSILRNERPGVGTRWDRWERDVGGYGLGGQWSTLSVTGLLILLASANTLYLFTRFRTYDMQLRSASDPVPSPNASPIPAPKSSSLTDDPFAAPPQVSHSTPLNVLQVSWRIICFLWGFTRSSVMAAIGRPLSPQSRPDGDKIQALHVWEPPEFCLAFFCAYPPSSPLLSHLLTPLHPFLTPFLLVVQSITLSHMAMSFNQLVKDRMVLSAEVMREYDRRFVYKRVFATRVDRGVGTNEAEMVW